MSYRHLISVIDHNSTDPAPIDFILTSEEFEEVERLIIAAAKSFMEGVSHPIVYLRGACGTNLHIPTWDTSYTVDGKTHREHWIDTYADQHARIEIQKDDGSRRYECSVLNASGHTVFYKEIDVSLDIPAFQSTQSQKAA